VVRQDRIRRQGRGEKKGSPQEKNSKEVDFELPNGRKKKNPRKKEKKRENVKGWSTPLGERGGGMEPGAKGSPPA